MKNVVLFIYSLNPVIFPFSLLLLLLLYLVSFMIDHFYPRKSVRIIVVLSKTQLNSWLWDRIIKSWIYYNISGVNGARHVHLFCSSFSSHSSWTTCFSPLLVSFLLIEVFLSLFNESFVFQVPIIPDYLYHLKFPNQSLDDMFRYLAKNCSQKDIFRRRNYFSRNPMKLELILTTYCNWTIGMAMNRTELEDKQRAAALSNVSTY